MPKGSCGKHFCLFLKEDQCSQNCFLLKSCRQVGIKVGYTQDYSPLCAEQPAMEFADQEIEDNGKWYVLKSTIQLHLDFSAIASCLTILFSTCLQEKT